MKLARRKLVFRMAHVQSYYVLVLPIFVIILLCVEADVQNMVETAPVTTLQNGTDEGLIKCNVKRTPVAVGWRKGKTYSASSLLVGIDLIENIKLGDGLLTGAFNITDNFSLVVKKVHLKDEGQYFCEAQESVTFEVSYSQTNLTVFVLPEEPYPAIEICLDSTNAQPSTDDQNCSVYNKAPPRQLVCSVDGYYPKAALLYFQHNYQTLTPIDTSEWENPDKTRGMAITVSSGVSFYQYECVVLLVGETSERMATIVIRERPVLTVQGRSRSTEITTISTRVLCKNDHVCIKESGYISHDMYILQGTSTSEKLVSVTFNTLPETVKLAVKAANNILSVATLRTLVLKGADKFSQEFFEEMETVSTQCKVRNILHQDDTLDDVTSRSYAEALGSMPCLRGINLINVHLHKYFYKSLALSTHSCKIESIYHGRDILESKSSHLYARALFQLSNLTVLTLKDVKLTNDFTHAMTDIAPGSKIEGMHQSGDFILDSAASESYARALFQMPSLRVLSLEGVELHDDFFKAMADTASTSNVQVLKINRVRPSIFWLGPEPSHHLAISLLFMPMLRAWFLDMFTLNQKFNHTFSEKASSSKVEKIWLRDSVREPDNSGSLPKGLSSMPNLKVLGIEYDMEWYGFSNKPIHTELNNSSTSLQVHTFILKDAKLTRGELRYILNIDTLRCLRFIRVKTETSNVPFLPGRKKHVTCLTLDAASLPCLHALRIQVYCSRINNIRFEATGDITDQLAPLTSLHAPSCFQLTALREPLDVSWPKSAEMRDTTGLCQLLTTSWSEVTSLAITDINIGDDAIRNILQVVNQKENMTKLSITRCGTTDILDSVFEEISSSGRAVSITHGEPRREDKHTYDGEVYTPMFEECDFDCPFRELHDK